MCQITFVLKYFRYLNLIGGVSVDRVDWVAERTPVYSVAESGRQRFGHQRLDEGFNA